MGATPSLCTGLLPPVLAAYRRRHPGVDLEVHESGSRDLEKSLLEGGLELALVIDASLGDDPELATEPLLTEDLVVISRHGDPGPGRGSSMTIAQLKNIPLVMFRTGYDLRETTVAACRAAGFEPRFAIEGGEMDAVLEFVQAGLGVAVVPSTVVRGRFTVTRISTPGLHRTVLLARRRGLEPSHAAQALIESLTEFLRTGAYRH